MSYSDLKAFWHSNQAPRTLDNHAVESWKATFEEFGLLYVITRSNVVTITPAGEQLYQAVQQQKEEDFVWIGLNLLFRYPLQGPPRSRRRSPAHGASDLLPYRFLYSAIRDLGDYFWWTELERIFCRVFSTSEARRAVDAVREIRQTPSKSVDLPLPVANIRGAFYNSLNQVANHAGLNHLALIQDNGSEHYGPNERRRRHYINSQYRSLVSTALGDPTAPSDCVGSAMYVERLPTAPSFADEQAYFDYLGATVASLTPGGTPAGPQAVNLAGDTVFILKAGDHFQPVSTSGLERRVQGKTLILCRIARNHRVILSTDVNWTYLVLSKELVGLDSLRIVLRRARPISNIEPIEAILGGDDA